MKTLINVVALVLMHGCSSVSFADGPRYRLLRPFRAMPTIQTTQVVASTPMQVVASTPMQVVATPTPMANPAVCTCEQPANVYVPTQSQYVYTESVPITSTPFFEDRPVANVVAAPFLFFQETAKAVQEVQPVRNVIKTVTPPYCKDGSCNLR
jgi:hypothetical protein